VIRHELALFSIVDRLRVLDRYFESAGNPGVQLIHRPWQAMGFPQEFEVVPKEILLKLLSCRLLLLPLLSSRFQLSLSLRSFFGLELSGYLHGRDFCFLPYSSFLLCDRERLLPQHDRSHAGTDQASIRVFNPQTKKVRTIVDRPGPAHEISLSWDGNTIYIGGGGKVSAVDVDGRNHRTLQSGQSPCEMPDGRLVFFDYDVGISPCKGGGLRQLLFICDPEGGNRKVVSANLTIDTSPSVMNNGRIIFTRWDYGVNKNVFNRHAIWAQNPDGTAMDLYFGNTVIDPRSMCRPRQVPGRPEVISVFGPHHAHLTGLIGLLWNVHGKEAADGLGFRRLTHDTASVGDRPPVYAYQDAQPLNEQLFLVSYGGRHDRKVGLYLLDRSGNKKCILETAGPAGVHSAQVFAARPRPPVIRDRSQLADWTPHVNLFEQMLADPDWSQKATMLLHDVYQGIEPEIERGRAAYLAVMEQVIQSGGRGGSMGVGTIWYANRVVGLVPIEEDGSAYFEVPALRSLYFHVLDKDGRMLMTQGSDFHAMPGEVRSCVGCHEQRKGIDTPPDSGQPPMAVRKRAVRPRMPEWGTNGIIEYEVTVQPVLDKHCVGCETCANVCPPNAITFEDDRDTGKRIITRNYGKCIFCGMCQEHCITGKGVTLSDKIFDLAVFERDKVIETQEKELVVCKHCKAIITTKEHIQYMHDKLGPKAFASTLNLNLLNEKLKLAPREETDLDIRDGLKRKDMFNIICPNCMRSVLIQYI